MIAGGSFIVIRADVEGLHHWPGATAPDGYLTASHRHLFVVTAEIAVNHNDREIEINGATRWLAALLASFGEHTGDEPLDFGAQSCEHLATRTAHAITDRYGPERHVRCVVLEDGILGAGVTWQPEASLICAYRSAGLLPPNSATIRIPPAASPASISLCGYSATPASFRICITVGCGRTSAGRRCMTSPT